MPTTTKSKTAKQAAVEALREAAEPLTLKELVERVLATPGVELKGKTPGATIAAILATENTRADGLFERTAPGTYGLRELLVPTRPPKPRSRQEES